MTVTDLREQLLKLRTFVLEGERWLADNAQAVDKPHANRKNLRRLGRNLKSYAEAAGRKTGVAVFGPSQAGKSTLISALGRGPSGSLKADFGTQSLDFAMQINPEGGNETTGLVTRFSLVPARPSPDQDKPVCLKLFSEMDLVKILANTFFAEGKGASRIVEDDLTLEVEALAAGSASSGAELPLDDLEDLAEYVTRLAPPDQSAYGQMLARVYWDRALRLAGRPLAPEGRAKLFSFLWGGLAPFTEVYMRLYQALAGLGFPETAFCGLTALFDEEAGRKFTVLHVNRLDGLLDDGPPDEGKAGPPVKVVSAEGRTAVLSRPVLSALIAELYVQVKERPGETLDHSDLLDFPGYRAREKLENLDEDLRKPEILKNCFLRGKVAYLFERYKARREIAAMLLCIGSSVQDNPDLPIIVSDWIRDTHGETPAARRAGRPVSLFVVLTKFDQHLLRGTSSTDTVTRWETRLNASLLDFFKGYDWPRKWSESAGRAEPFNNVFWLLNLSYASSFLELEETDDQGSKLYRAKGPRPDQAAWIEEVRQGYLKSDLVAAHIHRPEEAWGAVMKAPDGGVGYILEHLNPVLADSGLLAAQLAGQARRAAEAAEGVLRPWYRGAGSEKEMDIKKQSAKELALYLLDLARKKPRFGELLRDLQLGDDECQALHGAPSPEEDEAPKAEAAQAAVLSLDDIWGGPAEEPQAPPAKPAGFLNDAARRYRRRLERAWQAKLGEIAASRRHQRYFQPDPVFFQALGHESGPGEAEARREAFARKHLQILGDELSLGAKRLGVFDRLETRLREALSYSGGKPGQIAWKQARLAAADLAAYVNWLGFSPLELDRARRTIPVPHQPSRNMTLFEPPPPPGLCPELPDDQPAFDLPYYSDWTAALFRLMLDNVGSQGEPCDRGQDERLGGILEKIETGQKALP